MHKIAPVPNLNGSPRQTLVEQTMEIFHALEAAITLMARYQPHGRDYQIGGDFNADRDEYRRRLCVLDELATQYMTEAQDLQREGR